MSELYEHIRRKNPAGLHYDEAVRLFLWLYCSSDLAPSILRGSPINKETLVDDFQKLSADGLILDIPAHDSAISSDRIPWANLVESLLLNRVSLKPDFPKRASQYL